jgi:hypothetical protein
MLGNKQLLRFVVALKIATVAPVPLCLPKLTATVDDTSVNPWCGIAKHGVLGLQ